MTNMTGSKLSIFSHPHENNRLLDYYKIISISRPILPQPIWARLRLGPIWGFRDDNQANMEMPMY